MWELFAQWIAENHPDDPSTLSTAFRQRSSGPTMGGSLWEQRTREYVEAVNAASS